MKNLYLFFLVLVVSISGCATTNLVGIRNWIGDAGSPVSKTPIFKVYIMPPAPMYTNDYYRAGDNDYNYYQHHNKKMPESPPLKPSGVIMEGREAIYYSNQWNSNKKYK